MTEATTKLTIDGADPHNLSKLTDYQQGSVGSRTLLQNESGSLTVFSFDGGPALSEHTVPFNAFIQVLDGKAEITIGGKPCIVNSGEIVLMLGGVLPRFYGHFKKAYSGHKECLCRREGSSVPNLNAGLLNKHVSLV